MIRNKINKTPVNNHLSIIHEVESFDINKLLTSRYLGEGIYGVEQLATEDEIQRFMITPSLERMSLGREHAKHWFWDEEDQSILSCFNVELEFPSFLPIYTKEALSILDDITLLATKNTHIFTQFLFVQRLDDWSENAILQYDAYLNGNDFPSESRTMRSIQNKALNVLSKLDRSRKRRESIPEVESKVLDKGFRFEFRIMLVNYSGQEDKDIVNEIQSILSETTYFNSLKLSRINSKLNFLINIREKSMSPISQDQLLSEQEILSIFNNKQGLKENKEKIGEIKNTVTSPPQFPLYGEGSGLQAPIHLLFKKDVVKNGIERQYGKDIVKALNNNGLIRSQTIKTKKEERGATIQRIVLPIPKGVKFTQIESNLKNIQASLGVDGLSIEQGDESDTVSFLIPCEKRDIIYLRSLLENEEFIEFASKNPLPFVVGMDMNDELMMKCLTSAPHALITGQTGGGKSVFVTALIICLILFTSPSDLILYLIDPKIVELAMFKDLPHVKEIITDMNKAAALLYKLTTEMDKRYERFAEMSCREISTYNEKSEVKMPYIVLVIDELADLMMVNPQVEDYIQRIGQKARACGIHMVICTQRPEVKVITGLIKANIPMRISFSLQSSTDYRTVFDKTIPYRLLGRGDGCIRSDGQIKEFIRFQSPLLSLKSDEDEEAVFERLREYYKDQPVAQYEIAEPESDIDKMKRLICQTGETRVKELAKGLGTRESNVTSLLKQLEEEGFLRKGAKGREIAIDEEEQNKWRNQCIKKPLQNIEEK
ncbi:FtsK/SpoIIIE domain-containing protein [Priestia flexa]|uniref:FtsK/SpoIIIE domain-containing protein n=1 Tax=Priestia flexa TaxID=86664 RepID=UPI0013635058|nr:FtsK/SpoIIIE domain-containing protein [Priestia flexa]